MTSPVQESFENFENLKFDPFESKDVLLENSNDPDKNFYNNIQAVYTQYYLPSENFFMIHLNIRSAKKNFEKVKDFLSQTGFFFKVLYLTETWFDDRNSESSLYQLSQYAAIHQHRSPSHKSGREVA